MSTLDLIMRQPFVYRLWMAPFAEKKFAPILRHNDMRKVRRVLDVGCGPGTNAPHFAASNYLGIDLNPQYIRDAERRYGSSDGSMQFLARDAATFALSPSERFDFVLVNSFLHHVDDPTAKGILSNLSQLITNDGYIHILELILPDHPSITRFVARADRGNFPRPSESWRQMFEQFFDTTVFEPYDLGVSHVPLWKLLYFKGKPRGVISGS
jgi:2-polyprenyl-3-methyl-5-hydroxy-6-metoxy-1,4-benzoquinol methylase